MGFRSLTSTSRMAESCSSPSLLLISSAFLFKQLVDFGQIADAEIVFLVCCQLAVLAQSLLDFLNRLRNLLERAPSGFDGIEREELELQLLGFLFRLL